MIDILIKGSKVTFKGKCINIDYPVLEAYQSEDMVILLLDPDSNLNSVGQFKNLLAFSSNGELLWRAELPTTNSSGCYYKLISVRPLVAASFDSYICEIDINTGKVSNKTFVK